MVTKRILVRGRYRMYTFDPKGRIVSHVKWHRKRTLWEPALRRREAEKEVVYRSSMVYTYSAKGGMIDYRVWVYTENSDVTMSDLQTWITKLSIAIPTNANLREDMSGRELNEKVLKSDMDREGAEFGQWRGFAEFDKGGVRTAKYYATQSGTQFMKTRPFTTR